MGWSVEWGGKATDFVPGLLTTRGKAGPVAEAASHAVFEALQTIGNRTGSAWVRVSGQGWEKMGPGSGQFSITVQVMDEPSEVEQDLQSQQPHSLLS